MLNYQFWLSSVQKFRFETVSLSWKFNMKRETCWMKKIIEFDRKWFLIRETWTKTKNDKFNAKTWKLWSPFLTRSWLLITVALRCDLINQNRSLTNNKFANCYKTIYYFIFRMLKRAVLLQFQIDDSFYSDISTFYLKTIVVLKLFIRKKCV